MAADFSAESSFLSMDATQNSDYLIQIFFTDEATFSRNAITNMYNSECPSATSILCQSVGRNSLRSLDRSTFLPMRLNGEVDRKLLEEELPLLLKKVPMQLILQMYFMQDGAPAFLQKHVFSTSVSVYEYNTYGI